MSWAGLPEQGTQRFCTNMISGMSRAVGKVLSPAPQSICLSSLLKAAGLHYLKRQQACLGGCTCERLWTCKVETFCAGSIWAATV